jgi:HTH-type transcriptional regulator/antitoxin HigA
MTERVIKTRDEYEAALKAISELMERDPDPGTRDAEKLELLSLLVQHYESKQFEVAPPDPIEAIRFRIEQEGLSQRALVPYIGSRAKVSEVLSGKRPLTLSMIRALHKGLGIPAKALLADRDPRLLEGGAIEWEKFPLREMVSRGWIKARVADVANRGEELLREFMKPLGAPEAILALYRHTGHVRSGRQVDPHALLAWTARVLLRAEQEGPRAPFHPEQVTGDLLRELARLSWASTGPRLAQEFLAKRGVALVIEPHLAQTHLDGAAIWSPAGRPVVGMTIRHDRIDNFWFCLMHELIHIAKHLAGTDDRFYDDLDAESPDDPREREADRLAGEALIPQEVWDSSPAKSLHTPEAVQHLADQLRIHPAIAAGRIRHEWKRYRILNQLVGHGEVRVHFPEVKWR